jgi:inner membrane transporter RhtA
MATAAQPEAATAHPERLDRAAVRLPPASFFLISAVFHYLGPSLAVLLFAHVAVLGVMWLRIASAAAVFALWRRPWRLIHRLNRHQLAMLLALAAVLAGMNTLFYLAVARLPLATVGAIEFFGTLVLAAAGARTRRNAAALALAIGGVATLTAIRLAARPLGFVFAFGNCAGFMLYVMLGHRVANTELPGADGRADRGAGTGPPAWNGIDQLAAAMLIAAIIATPAGIGPALPALIRPTWLAWGIGVGICSSVIPYAADQQAMARLPRATFALMLALLPAFATVIGAIVLGQVPAARDLAGIGLVIAGVAIHRAAPTAGAAEGIHGQACCAHHHKQARC